MSLSSRSQPALLARPRPARRTPGPAGGWTGSGRCPGRPGRPPPASQRSPSRTRSASTVPSWSRTTVPSGTGTDEVVAPSAVPLLALPVGAVGGRRWGWSLKASSEATLRSATSQTSPPVPPSPPSGPPLGTWASRRNETDPAPPSPPLTWSPALVDELRHDSSPCGRELGRHDGLLGRERRRRACGPCGSRTSPCRRRVAKRVSSPPRPTFSPGWKWVPRWRTMMAPAVTTLPSNTLTPRRWAVRVAAVAGGARRPWSSTCAAPSPSRCR